MNRIIPSTFSLIFFYNPIFFLLFLCNTIPGFSQCDLAPLGPSDENQASYGYFSDLSSVSFQTKTFICYKDKASRIFVRQWDGVAWTTVGGGPVSSSTVAMDPHIAVDRTGKLYVIYREVYNAAHIAVRVWDGSAWAALGNDWVFDEYWGGNTNMVDRLAIAVDPANNIYIASFDQPSGEKLTVMKWNGTDWATVGSRGFSSGFVTDIHFAFDADGSPYVGFVQAFQGVSAEIVKLESGAWNSIRTTSLSSFEEHAMFLTNDRQGNVYFAYETTGTDWGVQVEKLESGVWAMVGEKIQTGLTELKSLSADDSDGLYLSYSDYSVSPKKAALKQWKNGNWASIDLGITVESRGAVNAIGFLPEGKMRFVYAELNGEAIMLEWNGLTWNELVPRGISDGIAGSPSVAIDKRGVPHVFYQDLKKGYQGVTQKWNGSSWVAFGNEIQSGNPVYDPRIVFNEDDIPYVAFTNLLNDFKLSVMKLEENQWQMVGNADFSNGQAGYTSIAFKDGVPFVAYADKSLGWKAIVKKWNGSIWETIGPEGISDRDASNTQISFDQNGNPLLVYLDINGIDAGKVNVKRWNGSIWENLGSGVISEGNVSSPVIVGGHSGSVYLAYREMALEQKLVIHKWDGTQWTSLGGSNVSTGLASTITLRVDLGGAPVVSFVDSGLGNQLIVKRWNGTAWEEVSQWKVSSNYFSSLSVAFDPAGIPFMAYSNGDVYAKIGKSALIDRSETQTINISESVSGAFSKDCELIALVKPAGSVPVSGSTTVKVWVESVQPRDFVGRHYEITPTNHASESTGRVTLFFTQEEFDTYNAVNSTQLPTNPSDLQGIANLLVEKRSGTSSDQTGRPGSYSDIGVNIDPDDSAIVWNLAAERWEVSFDVVGFSGFFVKTSEDPLPVRLVKFQGSRMEGKTFLSWETASEFGASHFEIERSLDTRYFQRIGTVTSQGTGNTAQSYSFLSNDPGFDRVAYYRLRMVDLDGSFTYSRTIAIGEPGLRDEVIVFPNPLIKGSQITIKGRTDIRQITLIDKAGRPLLKSWSDHTSGNPRLSVDNLSSGTYLLKIETENAIVTKPIVIE
ncbi:Por secretion system C-terminal sorting domain-containing protein [Dyadobacter sp. SG02]|nr:Por secretion system C-terminal sorting domain-containing protein [Dyadobacter sp. SG02]